MSIIQGQDRNQYEFSCLDDRVSRGSIVRVIDKIVDRLVPENEYQGDRVGRPKYPMRSLLKLYIYGYMHKIKSSRGLEEACKVNNEVIWLMQKLRPDHWTINQFRKVNGGLINKAIKNLIRFLIDTGYAEGREIVIDGTKIKANASGDEVISMSDLKERIEDVDRKIVYYLEAINNNDEQEEELRKLKEEKEELERRVKQLEEEKKRYYVKNDPDAGFMKTREGTKAAYNVQIACETKNKLIIATEISSKANDSGRLEEVYREVKGVIGDEVVKEVIADSGYYVPEQIERMEREEGVEVYVTPLPEQGQGEFRYDAQKDEYICQKGKRLRYDGQRTDRRGRVVRDYRTSECVSCSIKDKCTKSKNGRRKIRYLNQEYRDKYRQRMNQKKAKEKLKIRKAIVEHPIGVIKMWLGKLALLLRGREKVRTEMNIVIMAYDLLRVFNISGYERLREKIENYQWEMALI